MLLQCRFAKCRVFVIVIPMRSVKCLLAVIIFVAVSSAQTIGNHRAVYDAHGTLLPWTAAQGAPRIFVCDCNANPESPEYQQLRAMYHDAWADAVAAGTAKGRMDGITHKSSRIDYVFYDPGTALELVSMENVETPALIGVEASDHRPQLAMFRIK